MNQRKTLFQSLKIVLLATVLLSADALMAGPDPKSAVAPTNAPSIFIQPSIPLDGRDPFYPASSRPYMSAVVPTTKTTELNWDLLALQGVSGQPPLRLAIINKRTFAAGDNLEVSTSKGRIRVHCLEISEKAAIIEVNGQRHELRYEDNNEK